MILGVRCGVLSENAGEKRPYKPDGRNYEMQRVLQ